MRGGVAWMVWMFISWRRLFFLRLGECFWWIGFGRVWMGCVFLKLGGCLGFWSLVEDYDFAWMDF